jgi:hypothetical protein
MRIFVVRALLAVSLLVFAIAPAGLASAHAQSSPVQAAQTPQQPDQSRERDRGRAEDVKIGRAGRLREARTTTPGPLRRIRITKP